jgi:hypothetical protein
MEIRLTGNIPLKDYTKYNTVLIKLLSKADIIYNVIRVPKSIIIYIGSYLFI